MKKIKFSKDDYDSAVVKWTWSIFKGFSSDPKLEEKFDKAVGIKYIPWSYFEFEVIDEKKFMLAVLKYELSFNSL